MFIECAGVFSPFTNTTLRVKFSRRLIFIENVVWLRDGFRSKEAIWLCFLQCTFECFSSLCPHSLISLMPFIRYYTLLIWHKKICAVVFFKVPNEVKFIMSVIVLWLAFQLNLPEIST